MGRHVETAEYAGMVRRVVRALGRRAADDTDALAELVALRAELDRVADQAARDCHAAGYSWTEIGQALGVSRQAARQRFTDQLSAAARLAHSGSDMDQLLDALAADTEAQL